MGLLLADEPFTRLLRPGKQTTAFQNTTEGQIVAMGLQLANAPNNQLQVTCQLHMVPNVQTSVTLIVFEQYLSTS